MSIYADKANSLLHLSYSFEWETLREIQEELHLLKTDSSPTIKGFDLLKKQLEAAQKNLFLISQTIVELRTFIINNIPLKLN